MKGDARSVDALIAALRDESGDVREKAAWTLGMKGNSHAVEPLIPLVDRLEIDRAERAQAKVAQFSDEMSTDKSPCPADDNVTMVIGHESTF